MKLSHVDEEGRAVMVDISQKPKVRREAVACGKVYLKEGTIRLIRESLIKKGDVLLVAKVAAISGAKRTSDLIPLCHNIEIEKVDVDFTVMDNAVEIRSYALCTDKTGIEMEALTAVTIAALTIYDMCKAVDRSITITDIRLLQKKKSEVAQ